MTHTGLIEALDTNAIGCEMAALLVAFDYNTKFARRSDAQRLSSSALGLNAPLLFADRRAH
ncbi:MAG: hypothetical protein WAN23_00690 [Candidatus Acidiferrales bacterium]